MKNKQEIHKKYRISIQICSRLRQSAHKICRKEQDKVKTSLNTNASSPAAKKRAPDSGMGYVPGIVPTLEVHMSRPALGPMAVDH